ncbi:MAG: CehA/McbA family metallohydrolase [Lachnospiraceae bacterium]|nr:CehA/McbA family metallohydrolase [Lachnospiraceae bacterium]
MLVTTMFTSVGTITVWAEEPTASTPAAGDSSTGSTDPSSTPTEPMNNQTPLETVAVPQVSVAAGEVTKDTAVQLTCETEGAIIYVSREENSGYKEYDGSDITIAEDTTLWAYASKEGMSDSARVSYAYTVKEADTATRVPVISSMEEGNQVVIYHPASGKVLSTTAANSKFSGVDANVSDGGLAVPDNAMVLTARFDEESGNVTFVSNGKYLTTGATGNNLTLTDTESDYTKWKLDAVAGKENTFTVTNAKAVNRNKAQALEYYREAFTTYGIGTTDAYHFQFYLVGQDNNAVTPEATVDDTITATVAQWAGNGDYSGQSEDAGWDIAGDRYETNDMADAASSYYVVSGGKHVQPFTTGTGTNAGGVKNYYMGGAGIGATEGDYAEFATTSLGYGDMKLSFRMRGTGGATAGMQLQYSTDGSTYANFANGSYTCSYTKYGGEKPTEKKSEGNITDGIAKTNYVKDLVSQYITFTFDVPQGAANAEKLYIRLVPLAERATPTDKEDGKKVTKTGTLRFDSVQLLGHPIVAGDQVGYIKANPESGEIAGNTAIELTTATEGATVLYSLDKGETFQTYDAANKPVITEFPACIVTYGTKEGCKNSATAIYQYTQSKVTSVIANPNGGAIPQGQKITLRTKTEGATIRYAYVTDDNQADADLTWNDYVEPFAVESLPCTIRVKAVKEGWQDSAVSTLKFTKRQNDKYNIYFGQIHAHTNFSDGAGSPEEAFEHASKEVDNLDYLCITDHSNSLDDASESDITKNTDKDATKEWTRGHELAKQYSTEDFTCIYGYEMTWSNGLGHMNTFNTEGFQSRTQKEFSTYGTALNNYYAKLRQVPDSASMFNHPGTTFGDFQDFAYYSEDNDAVITMIEVGNGEGTIGSSGYFPSYEYYTRALDKGWHVAPANNQDNHKGKWGDANTARTVVLADTNTEANIYDAMKNYRMYATEDNNLSIYYTLDNYIMGTQLDKDAVGDTVHIRGEFTDADTTSTRNGKAEQLGKVEVIVNGGLSVASKQVNTNAQVVEFDIPANYSYYYLKVTEADGDIAVTAPVWVGTVEACGINKTYTNTALCVAGEPADINVDFFNNEKTPLEIDSITVTADDEEIATFTGEALADQKVNAIASKCTGTFTMMWAPEKAGTVKIGVTVKAKLNGVEKQYTGTMNMKFTSPQLVGDVVVDGTHYNDYVNGYYANNVTSFVKLGANKNLRIRVEKDEITAETLKDCQLLVISAPAKKKGEANGVTYVASHYSEEFLNTVKDYVVNGGTVIICGMADYQDQATGSTAIEQNKLLEAIGSTIRMNSDEVYDEVNNGGQPYRLYPTNFNMDSKFMAGIAAEQKYSQYSGCSVDITNAGATELVDEAEALVRGFDTTYSIDCKDDNGKTIGDGKSKVVQPGDVVFLAHQSTKAGGDIFVSGGIFMSDFEVNAEMDNNDSLPYANRNIILNILENKAVQMETTPIAEVRKAAHGEVFAVEGYVTSGTTNPDTTFFDTIYIQDDTAGIDIFPYAESGLAIGTKVRVVGTVDDYQGDLELRAISVTVDSSAEPKVYAPKVVDTKTAMDYDALGGSLLQTKGKVSRIRMASDGKTIEEFWLKDNTGAEAAIFIDGYILSGTTGKNELASFVKVGANIEATGILYMHPEDDQVESVPVFRVRDCDDIKPVSEEKPSQPSIGQRIVNAISNAVNTVVEKIQEGARRVRNFFRRIFRGNEAAAESSEVTEAAAVEAPKANNTLSTDNVAGDALTQEPATQSKQSIPVAPIAAGSAVVVVAAGAVVANKFGLLKVLAKLLKK